MRIEIAAETQRHCSHSTLRARLHDSNSTRHDARQGYLLGTVPTIEGGQLGSVGGDEARGDAAPVAAANDRHPVFGVPVVHLRRGSAGSEQIKKPASESSRRPSNRSSKPRARRTRMEDLVPNKRNKLIYMYNIRRRLAAWRRGECPSVSIASLDRTARRRTPRIASHAFVFSKATVAGWLPFRPRD